MATPLFGTVIQVQERTKMRSILLSEKAAFFKLLAMKKFCPRPILQGCVERFFPNLNVWAPYLTNILKKGQSGGPGQQICVIAIMYLYCMDE